MISESVLACPACKWAVRGGRCIKCHAWVFGAQHTVARKRTPLHEWTIERQTQFVFWLRDLLDRDPMPDYTRKNK